jgi:hypothetical protein
MSVLNHELIVESQTKHIYLILQDLIDIEGEGLAEMAYRCVQEMDIDNRMPVRCYF